MSSLTRCFVLAKFINKSAAIEAGKSKIEWFTRTSDHRELDRNDGEPRVLEWKNFPGHTTLQ